MLFTLMMNFKTVTPACAQQFKFILMILMKFPLFIANPDLTTVYREQGLDGIRLFVTEEKITSYPVFHVPVFLCGHKTLKN